MGPARTHNKTNKKLLVRPPSSSCNMSGRQGGKAKPLKAPKKKTQEFDDEDVAFKAKQKADAAAKKAMAEKAKKGGPMVGGGIKKSGKK